MSKRTSLAKTFGQSVQGDAVSDASSFGWIRVLIIAPALPGLLPNMKIRASVTSGVPSALTPDDTKAEIAIKLIGLSEMFFTRSSRSESQSSAALKGMLGSTVFPATLMLAKEKGAALG
ncbi:MAG: hypothetical protein ACR2LZ_01635 [Pyrinomonadaceae bacterium]